MLDRHHKLSLDLSVVSDPQSREPIRTKDGCVCLAGPIADEPVLVPKQAGQEVDVLLGQASQTFSKDIQMADYRANAHRRRLRLPCWACRR